VGIEAERLNGSSRKGAASLHKLAEDQFPTSVHSRSLS
jgi:hypothetical protein